MKRRRACAATALVCVGLPGCLSETDDPRDESSSPNATDESTPTGTGSPTPTDPPKTAEPTPTPTRTIPPFDRELNELYVWNDLDRPVTVEVEISVRDSEESKQLTVELEPGTRKKYDDLSILEEPIVLAVTHDGETYEYTPQSDGIINVRITPDGIEFEEVVT